MTEKINLTQLRERAEQGWHHEVGPSNTAIAVGPSFTPEEVLALIDTAEAALAWAEAPTVVPNSAVHQRLRKTLNRYQPRQP